MRYSHGLEYTVSKDGVAVLCGIGNCTDEHIVIPPEVDGFTVVGVENKAFYRSQIKSIELPSSVRFIRSQAFAWCRQLVEVKALNISEIGDRAFMGCDKLLNISFGNRLESIGQKSFAYCPSLLSIALPNSLTRLGSASFEGCRNLERICLSDNISIIENGTFYACGNLRQIIFPSKLEFIDEFAFAYCTSLSKLEFPKNTVVNRDAFFECAVTVKVS